MGTIRHPLSNAVYDHDADVDEVVVVDESGRTGRFGADGDWRSGDLRTADPELCRWISGPRLASRHRKVVEEQEEDQ